MIVDNIGVHIITNRWYERMMFWCFSDTKTYDSVECCVV